MRADRLLSLLLLLQNEGKTKAADLAGRLEVSPRTIYRDVEALSAAGVPVYAEPGPRGGIALVEGYRTRLTGLSRAEAEALSALPTLRSAARAGAGLGLGRPLESALLKLAATLPTAQRLAAEHARARLHVDTAPWFRPPEDVPHLETLRRAVWQDRRLRLAHLRAPAGEIRERTVEPHALVVKVDRWYLVARAERGMRVFRAARILGATVLDETFARDPAFDLTAFWEDWCRRFEATLPHYPVTLRASAAGRARLGERGFPPEPAPDGPAGALRVDFQRPTIALETLLALGPEVEILAPPELRRDLLRAVERLRRHHGRGA